MRLAPTEECNSCGARDLRSDVSGRLVCCDCGCVMPGGTGILDGVSYTDREVCGPNPPCAEFHGFVMSRIREMHPSCEGTALGFVLRLDALIRTRSQAAKQRVAQAIAYVAYRLDGVRVRLCTLAAQVGVSETKLRKEVNAISEHLGIVVNDNVEDETDMFEKALLCVVRPSLVRGGRPGVARITQWCKDVMRKIASDDDSLSVEFLNCPPERQAHAMVHLYTKNVHDPFVGGAGRTSASVAKCVKILERAVARLETTT